MLQQIDTKHLAALESELARVTAQRDALRDAISTIANFDPTKWDAATLGNIARSALVKSQACQD